MANLQRWSPFEDALSLRDAMNRLVEESFVWPTAGAGRPGGALPVEMNVLERNDVFLVEAAVPGLKPEDIDITLQDNVLTISGETQQEERQEGTTYHRTERRYGRFSRSISLPTPVKADSISATLENGVLKLEVPKAEEAKPRKIAVQGHTNGQRTIEAGGKQ